MQEKACLACALVPKTVACADTVDSRTEVLKEIADSTMMLHRSSSSRNTPKGREGTTLQGQLHSCVCVYMAPNGCMHHHMLLQDSKLNKHNLQTLPFFSSVVLTRERWSSPLYLYFRISLAYWQQLVSNNGNKKSYTIISESKQYLFLAWYFGNVCLLFYNLQDPSQDGVLNDFYVALTKYPRWSSQGRKIYFVPGFQSTGTWM